MLTRHTIALTAAVLLTATTLFAAPPTAALSLSYAGSTTETLSADQIIDGMGLTQNPNLTLQNLSDPTLQTTAWRHYFDISVTFSTATPTAQALAGIIDDLKLSSGLRFITPDGSTSASDQKYFSLNDATFSVNGDAGLPGDLLGLTHIITSASTAFALDSGAISIGRFALEFTDLSDIDQSITVTPSAGRSFGYWTRPSTRVSIDTGLSGDTFIIPLQSTGFERLTPAVISRIPEPATLGILAMATLALFPRRRKS